MEINTKNKEKAFKKVMRTLGRNGPKEKRKLSSILIGPIYSNNKSTAAGEFIKGLIQDDSFPVDVQSGKVYRTDIRQETEVKP